MTADPHDPTPNPRSADGPDILDNALTPDLTDLCQSEIEPILLRYFSGKLRSSMRHSDDARVNQDALELVSEAKVRILKKLCRAASGGDAEKVDDIDAYARTVARNVFHQYLRNKYPRRLSVKNQCRYLLTHHRDLDIWKGENDIYLCGLGIVDKLSRPKASPELAPEILGKARRDPETERISATASDVMDTVFLVLRHADRPVSLDDLVSAVMEILQINEPVETPQTDDVSNLPGKASSTQLDIEAKEFVKRLWREVVDLPVRHRAALLLNFRDENGDDLASSFVMNGAATMRELAAASGMEAEEFARVWKELPWDDMRIALHLGLKRQQVINLRQSAKQKLRRKLGG